MKLNVNAHLYCLETCLKKPVMLIPALHSFTASQLIKQCIFGYGFLLRINIMQNIVKKLTIVLIFIH
jgi:hypothetical protein